MRIPTPVFLFFGLLCFVLKAEYSICISSSPGAPLYTWMIGWHFFFLLRRKFCVVVAQVGGYYSKLPNEGVRNTCSQLIPMKRAHKISTVNLRHSGHLGTKSNYSGYTECYCSGNRISIIRKFAHRLADDDNYHDERASLPVSLRTRKLEKKIRYCCRDSFFVKKDM